jgi:hypothetical protein
MPNDLHRGAGVVEGRFAEGFARMDFVVIPVGTTGVGTVHLVSCTSYNSSSGDPSLPVTQVRGADAPVVIE